VIGRVKINKIVNPDVWWDRSTYLKVEVEDFPDSDEGVRFPPPPSYAAPARRQSQHAKMHGRSYEMPQRVTAASSFHVALRVALALRLASTLRLARAGTAAEASVYERYHKKRCTPPCVDSFLRPSCVGKTGGLDVRGRK